MEIEKNSRNHDQCMLVNKGDDLICEDCPWVCEVKCGECPVCEKEESNTMLVRFQAHVRGFLDRLYTEVVVSCTMQEILETQDPDLEEQYDILDGLYTRVYSNY